MDIGEIEKQIEHQRERVTYSGRLAGRSKLKSVKSAADMEGEILKSLRLVPKLLALKGEVEAMLPWLTDLWKLDAKVSEVIPLRAGYRLKRLKAALAALDAGDKE